jgi:hypothetical protein
MAGQLISSCRSFPATYGGGRRCTLLHWKDYALRPPDPSVRTLRREYVTTRRREELVVEGQGRYRTASGVLYTSDDPEAPGH